MVRSRNSLGPPTRPKRSYSSSATDIDDTAASHNSRPKRLPTKQPQIKRATSARTSSKTSNSRRAQRHKAQKPSKRSQSHDSTAEKQSAATQSRQTQSTRSIRSRSQPRSHVVRPKHSSGIQTAKTSNVVAKDKGLRVIFVRDTQRMDTAFPEWIASTFDGHDFSITDMNQYQPMIKRENGVRDMIADPPLTGFGRISAQIVGRGFSTDGVRIRRIYSSPAYRCVETANNIIEAYKMTNYHVPIKICIEPGLFEPAIWYRTIDAQTNQMELKMPNFLETDHLLALQYPIDKQYRANKQLNDPCFQDERSEKEAYCRVGQCVADIVSTLPNDGNANVFVCHPIGIDAAIRFLNGRQGPGDITHADYFRMGECYPPGCAIGLKMKPGATNWQPAVRPPYPLTTYGMSTTIDTGFIGRCGTDCVSNRS